MLDALEREDEDGEEAGWTGSHGCQHHSRRLVEVPAPGSRRRPGGAGALRHGDLVGHAVPAHRPPGLGPGLHQHPGLGRGDHGLRPVRAPHGAGQPDGRSGFLGAGPGAALGPIDAVDHAKVGRAPAGITLSRRTRVVGKARECRTGAGQFKRAQRRPRRVCGGPSGAAVRARLGVASLDKGPAIACGTRLDSNPHSGSEHGPRRCATHSGSRATSTTTTTASST